ncbi:MAG: ATP-binding protein, partial [Candidatus Omnitrophota bacterium]
ENARLVEKMKQAEAALERHREHLEEMVEERTRQLNKAQNDLIIAGRLAVLGQLAGSISHEIRNPLNVIGTSAYYLKIKFGKDDKKFKEHIDHIEAEVRNSTAIIDSILSLSGLKEPRKETLELVGIIDDAISGLEIPEEVEIVRHVPVEKIFLSADKEQMFMLFHNIIKNALQAMNNKGKVVLTINKEEGLAKISFVDTGAGVSPENMAKLFQPLFTTKERGFGFGLLICKMIVEKHQGTINMESEVGKGTVVKITFPLSDG